MSHHDRVLHAVQKLHPLPADPLSLRDRLRAQKGQSEGLCLAAGFHPGLTAWLLGVANSALLASPVEVHSVRAALARVGGQRLASALQSSVVEAWLQDERLMAGPDYQHPAWEASVILALAAEEVARLAGLVAPSEAFTAGLCAEMAVWTNPEKYLGESSEETQREKEAAGAEEHEHSARLLEEWGWPKRLVAGVRWHDRPDLCPAEHRALADTLQVAQHLRGLLGCLQDLALEDSPLQRPSLRRLFLSERDFDGMLERLEARWQSVLGAFQQRAA